MQRANEVPIKDMQFYKLNADHCGIYRTLYTPSRLMKLGETASRADFLSVQDRAGMVADAGTLSASGYQNTSVTMSLLKLLGAEKEYIVWREMTSWPVSLRQAFIFGVTDLQASLQSFVLQLTTAEAHEVGWMFTQRRTTHHTETQSAYVSIGRPCC